MHCAPVLANGEEEGLFAVSGRNDAPIPGLSTRRRDATERVYPPAEMRFFNSPQFTLWNVIASVLLQEKDPGAGEGVGPAEPALRDSIGS